MRRTWLAFGALTVLAFAMSLPRGRRQAVEDSAASNAFRVALVFDIGGRGDKSFNDSAYLGLLRAQKELGVTVEVVEPTGAEDREAALRLFAARGFPLVIGVGFIFSRDIDTVAQDYPAIRFACVDYGPRFTKEGVPLPIPSNVTGLAFREEEGSYLVGAVAGLTTKTKHLGFVGGMDIPLIHKFEAGYRAGAAKVCPSCVVHVAYAGSTPEAFRDPAKGKAIAIAQIALGADVLFHASGSTGHGVFEAARAANVQAIGVDADQWDEAPGHVLTSMVKDVDVAVLDAIARTQRGTLPSGMLVLGLAEGGMNYVSDGPHAANIAVDTKAQVESLKMKIVSHEIVVPSE